MDKELLLKLRKRQYILMNTIILALFILFLFFDSPNFNRIFYIFMSALMIINIVNYIKKKEITMNFIPFMKPLVEYQKEKLGPEWGKMQKQNFIMQIVLLVLFLPKIFSAPTPVQLTIKEKLSFFIPILIILLLAVNIGTFLYARKIDQSDTEKLSGYAKKNLVFGLVFGFALAALIIAVGIIWVIFQV